MSEKLVSLIVPVHNTARYLPKCIESMLYQTYKKLEIILVDDGSTDKSLRICNKYAVKDPRIKVIHKDSPEGGSLARNAGLDIATGEYVCFIDSDDWIPSVSVEVLKNELESNEADIVWGNMQTFSLKGRQTVKQFSNAVVNVSNVQPFIDFIKGKGSGPVGKIYKRIIIEQNLLRFEPGIKIGEDAIFLFRYLQHCNRVCDTNAVVYYYNKLNFNSATRKQYSQIVDWAYCWMSEYVKLFVPYNDKVVKEHIREYIIREYIYISGYLDDKNKDLLRAKFLEFIDEHNYNMYEKSWVDTLEKCDNSHDEPDKYTTKTIKFTNILKKVLGEILKFLIFDIKIIKC